MWLNGVEFGEVGLYGVLVCEYGVYVVFVIGDDVFVDEM